MMSTRVTCWVDCPRLCDMKEKPQGPNRVNCPFEVNFIKSVQDIVSSINLRGMCTASLAVLLQLEFAGRDTYPEPIFIHKATTSKRLHFLVFSSVLHTKKEASFHRHQRKNSQYCFLPISTLLYCLGTQGDTARSDV